MKQEIAEELGIDPSLVNDGLLDAEVNKAQDNIGIAYDDITAEQEALLKVKQQIAADNGITPEDVTSDLLAGNVARAHEATAQAKAIEKADAADAKSAADAQAEAQAAYDAALDAYENLKTEVEGYQQAADQKAAEAEAARSAAADIQQTIDAIEAARDDVKDAQKDADAAYARLDALKQQIADELGIDPDDVTDTMLEQRVADTQAEADKAAKEAADAAKAAEEAQGDAVDDAKEAAQKAAQNAQEAQEAAEKAVKDSKSIKDAEKAVEDAQTALADAQAELDKILTDTGASEPSITTGGDINVTAENVGTDDNALSTDVSGQLNIGDSASGDRVGDVNVENSGDLTMGPIDATDVKIAATGDIAVANDDGSVADISGDSVSIRSAGSDVGAKDDPMTIDADALDAYGRNVYIEGYPDLEVDSVVAEDEASISAPGDINDTGNGAGVIADKATIAAGGNIGSEGNPLNVNADRVSTISGGDTDLSFMSPTTEVDAKAGGDVGIDSTGAVQGKADGQSVTITADGDIGSAKKAFEAVLPNMGDRPSATSNYGRVWIDKLPHEYTVKLNLNGGELDGESGTITYVFIDGSIFELPLPTRAGYRFLYWLGSIFYAGDEYAVTENHTFKAIWEKIVPEPDPKPDPQPEPTPGPTPGPHFGDSYAARAARILPRTSDILDGALVGLIVLVSAWLLAAGLLVRKRNEA